MKNEVYKKNMRRALHTIGKDQGLNPLQRMRVHSIFKKPTHALDIWLVHIRCNESPFDIEQWMHDILGRRL